MKDGKCYSLSFSFILQLSLSVCIHILCGFQWFGIWRWHWSGRAENLCSYADIMESRILAFCLWVIFPSCSFNVFELTRCSTSFPVALTVKKPPAMRETWVPSLGREDPLEKEMATHSSIVAWEIPWTEELGGLPSMDSQSLTRLNDLILSLLCHMSCSKWFVTDWTRDKMS